MSRTSLAIYALWHMMMRKENDKGASIKPIGDRSLQDEMRVSMRRAQEVCELDKLFFGIQLPVFAGEEERRVGIGALIAIVDFTRVKRLRIDVDADGALVEFRHVHHFMDRFHGIDIGGMRGVEIVELGGDDAAGTF